MEPLNDLIRQAAKVHGKPIHSCVNGEQLDAYYAGSLSKSEADELRMHLSSCPACLELARDYCRFAGLKAPRAPFAFKPVFRIAAVIVVMVSAGWMWTLREQPTDTTTMRGTAAPAVEILGPKGSVAAAPAALEWKPLVDAVSYEVEILDMDLNVVWKALGIGEARTAIPDDIRLQLRPGDEYGWRVTAVAPSGRRSVSPLETFRVEAIQR